MSIRTTPVQSRANVTLDKIETAAKEVLAEVGRDRITTGMVAERAGVSIGTLYRYFEDRVALLDAIQPLAKNGIEAVLELHAEVGDDEFTVCRDDGQPWPCDTVSALTGR